MAISAMIGFNITPLPPPLRNFALYSASSFSVFNSYFSPLTKIQVTTEHYNQKNQAHFGGSEGMLSQHFPLTPIQNFNLIGLIWVVD